jgi:protein-S-isoprenylcysteine O-methyltransferase Ste14
MAAFSGWIFPVLWSAWAAYWVASSRRVRPTKRAQGSAGRMLYIAELFLAYALVSLPFFHRGWLGAWVLPRSRVLLYSGAALTAAGLGFAVWARVHLGEYWSGNVTLKEGHRLIRSGPYAFVRHPIYTGMLFGMLGTAVAVDQVRGYLAVAIMLQSFVRKLRKEEAWLTEEFGEEYAAYRREVRALL